MADFDGIAEVFAPFKPWIAQLFKPLSIAGVEVTQAIQYCRAAEHLKDKNDRGPDNSLALVADKPAVVRVYVHGGFEDVPNVHGTVGVQRRQHGIWVDAGTLTSIGPASITAFRDAPYASERGSLTASLNFLIPGEHMQGEMRLKVHVEQPGHPGRVDDAAEVVYATLRQTLKLRGIPIQYWGPDSAGKPVKLPALTLADFVAECAWTCNVWPVSPRPDVTLAGTFTWNNPMTGKKAKGSCPTSWGDLLFWLKVARVLDGDRPDRFYFAFLPNGVPVGDTPGCGSAGGVGASFRGANGGTTLAHELGHVLTFDHVRGPKLPPDDDTWDRNYPVYEPYDSTTKRTGTIGEYGLDVTASMVMPPNACIDFMAYGPNRWISPHRHELMIQNPRLAPQWLPLPRESLPPVFEEAVEWPPAPPNPPDPPWGRWTEDLGRVERGPFVVVLGRQLDGRVEMSHVLRLDAFAGSEGRAVDGMALELLDRDGGVVSRALVYATPTSACGEGCGCDCDGDDPAASRDLLVQASVPDPEPGSLDRFTTIRLVNGDDEVWRRDAPGRPPRVFGVEASVDGDRWFLRWEVDRADDAVRIDRFVRWSSDDGRTWDVLAIGIDADSVEGSLEPIAPGTALVQVLVSDGFHTAVSESVAIEVPWRPPTLSILWPRADAPVRLGTPLRVWGVATACDGRALDGEAVAWELDGDRVAVGADQWLTADLREGEHRLVLRADDGTAGADAEVVFRVGDEDRPG